MDVKEYIYHELMEDGTLPEECDMEEISRDLLLQQTDLEECDIDDLVEEYKEYCEDEGIEPEGADEF